MTKQVFVSLLDVIQIELTNGVLRWGYRCNISVALGFESVNTKSALIALWVHQGKYLGSCTFDTMEIGTQSDCVLRKTNGYGTITV